MPFQAPIIPPCETVEELRFELERIFGDIEQSQTEQLAVENRPVFVAPSNPREGMIVYADGVVWNPGSGPGSYEFTGGLWRPLFTIPTGSVLNNPTFTGIVKFDTGANLDLDTGTVGSVGSGVAASATLNKMAGKVLTPVLTVAPLNAFILTLNNTLITATSLMWASYSIVTLTTGIPIIGQVTPGAGFASIALINMSSVQSFNGSVFIVFLVGAP